MEICTSSPDCLGILQRPPYTKYMEKSEIIGLALLAWTKGIHGSLRTVCFHQVLETAEDPRVRAIVREYQKSVKKRNVDDAGIMSNELVYQSLRAFDGKTSNANLYAVYALSMGKLEIKVSGFLSSARWSLEQLQSGENSIVTNDIEFPDVKMIRQPERESIWIPPYYLKELISAL